MNDAVNNPKHYTSHPSVLECIELSRHLNFNRGNALKYIWRAELKENKTQDIEKANTEIYDGFEKIKDHFNFKTSERCKLSDLREQVKKEVLDKDDYLPVCTQCLVTARVMM